MTAPLPCPRPEISRADLVRAAGALHPDPETLRRIAGLLGFSLAHAAPDEPPPLPPVKPPGERRPSPAPFKPKRSGRRPAAGAASAGVTVRVVEEPSARSRAQAIRRAIEALELALPKEAEVAVGNIYAYADDVVDGFREYARKLETAPELPPPLPEHSETREIPPPYVPLFRGGWTRALLARMLAVDTHAGPPDVDRLVALLAQRRPFREIPRLRAPTLRRGVQLLIDSGPGLTPYLRDQEMLLEDVRRVVGSDRVEVWEFIGTPLRTVVVSSVPGAERYAPPAPGTPVLLLSDLGIASPPSDGETAAPQEWVAFARRVREAGCPLVALVPYAPARWPRALREHLRMLQWDRGTSVLTVLRAPD